MKHIFMTIFTIFIFILMGYTYKTGSAYHGGEAGKIVEDIKSFETKKQLMSKAEDNTKDELKALKDKAGNIGKFKVSKLYRNKCASCHGVNGNGIIGPKLYGQSSDTVYKKLTNYKSGRTENAVMKGILISIDNAQLKIISDEIGQFQSAK